jgi:Domain of unknown function (DUF4328)
MLKAIQRFYTVMHIVYALTLFVSLLLLYFDYSSFSPEDPNLLLFGILVLSTSVCNIIALIVFFVFQVMWTYKLGSELINKDKIDLKLWHGTWGWFIPFANLYLPLQFIQKVNDSLAKNLSKKDTSYFANTNQLFAIWFYVSLATSLANTIYSRVDAQNKDMLLIINCISIVLTAVMYYYGISALQKQYQLSTSYLKKSKVVQS